MIAGLGLQGAQACQRQEHQTCAEEDAAGQPEAEPGRQPLQRVDRLLPEIGQDDNETTD